MIGSLPPEELAMLLRSLGMLLLGAWLARPLALRLVPGGSGWVAALLLAWAVIGWVPWLLAATGAVPFAAATLSGPVVLALLRARAKPAPGMAGAPGHETGHEAGHETGRKTGHETGHKTDALAAALAVIALTWLGLAQRLGNADLTGLEKFTDMGLLSAAMRASWMPPEDVWYAGKTVNYYYVGQAMAAVWGRIAAAPADKAYQIVMAMLFALAGLGSWRLTAGLAMAGGQWVARLLGSAAAALTLYGGNFHSVLYTLLRQWMPTTKEAFYFPDSTRFIGFDPPVADKAFTEFPAYAFAVGDLHAHVAATPVFFLGLMLILAILARGLRGERFDLMQVAALGWVLGLCVQVNSWDAPILGLVALLVALVLAVRPTGRLRHRLDRLGAAAVLAAGTAFVTAAPFSGHFTPFAKGIVAAPASTPLWQIAALYGHALPALALFALVVVLRPTGASRRPGELLGVAVLFTAALALIALPEAIVMRDIYALDLARANTMFKLSFRAQSLLFIAGLAALAPAVGRGRRWFAGAMLAALPMVATLAYAPHVFRPPSVIRSLDGLGFLGAERALVEAAGRLSLAPGEAIVEASGDAFGSTGRVSAMTGLPTVIGWANHEWLWRGDGEAAHARAERVRAFYTSTDPALLCAIARRYNIRYVILGQAERESYPEMEPRILESLGSTILDDPAGRILRLMPGRCPGIPAP